ncbi:MAG TPA: hypothetical protein VLA44_02755 [Clostridia bacterium]|nr:hypothetical protein [Clostridia bacterium]
MSGPFRFEELEADYAALRDAFGALLVDRHRGAAVAAAEQDYAVRRAHFAEQLTGARATATDRPALAAIESTLAWMDEWQAVAGAADVATGGPEPPEAARLRRNTMEAFGAASEAVRVGAETIDRLTALARLATDPDPLRRRAIFEAMAPIWRAVDGGDDAGASPYRELLRSSAARWARDGSPAEAAATALGKEPGTLEPTLRAMLEAWRGVVGPGLVEPWDYRFAIGALERRLGWLLPRDRLRAINDAHLRGLGADPAVLGIRYDVEPRGGRPAIPVAFTFGANVARRTADGAWRPSAPWVFATYEEGGLGNLEELLHESGHALHYAAIRTRPAFFEPPIEAGGFVEGVADLVGWDVHEPAFQARHLGQRGGLRESRLARYGGVMLDVCWALFEIELHRDPERSPNETWGELTETGLGIVAHPEWSWWAMRGQLVEAPGYMTNYALSAIVAAALRARIGAVRGDWLRDGGDPGWYEFVSSELLRFGAERPAGDVLAGFLGRALTVEPLLDDLATARR